MPLSWNEIRDRSVAFVREWESESSEHAEAKSFWDEFFQVFGVSRRRLAAFEKHVKKADGKDGFIDLFWPGMLLAEHKSRGKNLDSAYDQATDYFPGLSDKELPRYIIVSDFANFRIRNLDTGESDEFPLSELPQNLSHFGFIAGYETRQYKEQDPVNTKAAEKLAQLHDALKEIGYEGHELEVYLVRILFCMFADDTGIFMPRSAFEDFIRDRTAEDGSDLAPRLNQIFQTLNTPPEKRLKNLDEQIAAFPYVNGKLFAEFLPQASFDRSMRETLLDCCELDWGAISPAIFGSLFQGIMDANMRRNLGAHYTSEKNILKVIGPLFMDELREEFEKVKTQPKKLQEFHDKLGSLNFFDPACGCGNFLVISYREIRLLELEVIKRLYGKDQQQLSMDAIDQYVRVDVDQFHGIEIEEWPAQIAQVAMWLIDHQMNLLVGEAFGQALVRVPLVKSANVVHGNALRLDWNEVIPSDRCNYVFGNPPFVGAKYMDAEQRKDVAVVFQDVPSAGLLDFVAAWYAKSAVYMSARARCGFVSTNSICQGEQVAVLWGWMFSKGIQLDFAHRTFKWRNEAKGVAAVHCVIVGFSRCGYPNKKIFDYESISGEPQETSVKAINPYLVEAPNALIERRRSPICEVPQMQSGNKPIDGGNYLFTPEEKAEFLIKEPQSSKYFKRWLGGYEFVNNVERWILWLGDCEPGELKKLPESMKRVASVREFRLKSSSSPTKKLASSPTRFHTEFIPQGEYIAMPQVSSERRPIIPIAFLDESVMCGDKLRVIEGVTLYHFGVLLSSMHMSWTRSVTGRLKSDYQYSALIVYNNFPWPMSANEKQQESIKKAAQEVLDARSNHKNSSLADLYDPLTMPSDLVKAHERLDRAVDAAYVPSGGKKTWATETERVAFLFELYQKITSLLPAEKPKAKRKKSA
ncbi:class I SAM-dependent DNA methyltransferase [Zhongshania marina]|uniref:site-specific DNA-methyltransferase (adenine-specific) n=1 Tax=Zhongshania marina TaxID=2304603 RepID=A0A2S4HC49_9GAMM|nr:DNA methyltransferase [Marortus luteolus]POP51538.1 SAM-dependent methyltransferase [Marortus luteolus]